MAIITLDIPNPINVSLQAKPTNVTDDNTNLDNGVWDCIYFIRVNSNGDTYGDIYKLGDCVGINIMPGSFSRILVSIEDELQTPAINDYIFFGKNNSIGVSGLIGYYAQVHMKNDSDKYAEIYAANSELSSSESNSAGGR